MSTSSAEARGDTRLWLAVETSTQVGSVALWRDGATLAERVLDTPIAGPGLLGEIEGVLATAAVGIGGVDAFAIGLGPGAFTSLRVGLATVKGLAYALDRAVVGVHSLRALALRARRCALVGATAVVVPVIDARRGEVYAAAYDPDGGCVLETRACSPEALAEALRDARLLEGSAAQRVIGVGGGAVLYSSRLGFACVDDERLQAPHAAEVAALARRSFDSAAVRGPALAALAPYYVRPADAQVNPKFALTP